MLWTKYGMQCGIIHEYDLPGLYNHLANLEFSHAAYGKKTVMRIGTHSQR